MNFLNLGIGEVIFIILIALIIFGPGNMVKTAREIGGLIRKVTKSPYWREVWATRRELTEIPKMIAKEAQLDETIRDLNKETQGMKSSVSASISDFIREVESPVKDADKEAKDTPTDDPKPIETPDKKEAK